ncbi:MAG: hypothetical protein GT601_17910 [Acidaminobacter sp.]|uniref:hypothetical protein n=1 Tax=Acidaminobacter sp. TaxID=1872102 RepID=UPI0013823428|nr:hypothetical protein [Acidaminobacter sp.]MZQ99546.1 hypothetical protein [Acidaminobacter sp.]
MKQIVYGKLYDTDSATLLAKWQNNFSEDDIEFFGEELYKTCRGSYFLVETSSGLEFESTEYESKQKGKEPELTTRIKPISAIEAKNWCEDNVSSDDYINIFGPVPLA